MRVESSPEDKLVRDLTLAIARGLYRAGELLPPETELAHQLLIAPNKITSAYHRLAELQLVLDFGDHRTMVVENASNLAKAHLLRAFATDLQHDLRELHTTGCSREEMRHIIEAVLEEVPDAK